MAINVNVQYNGGFLPDIILLTQCYLYRGTCLNAMKRFCICRCVCVFFPFILDVKLVGSTSRGHTGFLIHIPSAVRAFIFLARRIQPFLSLVERKTEMRENPSYRDSNSRPKVSEGYEVTN